MMEKPSQTAGNTSHEDLSDPGKRSVQAKRDRRRRSIVLGMQAVTESIKERQVNRNSFLLCHY